MLRSLVLVAIFSVTSVGVAYAQNGQNCANGVCIVPRVTPVRDLVLPPRVAACGTQCQPVKPVKVLRCWQGPIWTRCFGRYRYTYKR